MIFSLICGLVMLLFLFVDLMTKAAAEAAEVSREFIPGFMRFTFTKNFSIAFSPTLSPLLMGLITALTVVMIIAIAVIFFTYFKKNRPVQVCLAVIEAGALGNLVDRLCLGYVRDFLDVTAFKPFSFLGSGFNFGICNLADFYITFGAVALFIIILFIGKDAVIPLGKWRKQQKESDAKKEETDANP